MKRWSMMRRAMTLGLIGLFAGWLPAWGCLAKVGEFATSVNPCGTILNCDPVEFDLLMNRYPDYSVDPTCTIPGLCGGTWPYAGVGGTITTGGGTGTNTGTGTGTNTGTGTTTGTVSGFETGLGGLFGF